MSQISQIEKLEWTSELLRNSFAGDSHIRPVSAYIPLQSGSFPVLFYLPPWTHGGRTAFDWQPFKESLQARLDRLIESKLIPPVVVVAVDLFTRFGGSQFIDSSYFGPHGSALTRELVPFVEKNLPVKAGNEHRGVFGRSSGGFGALRLALDFPNIFSRVACHAGDMGFDLLYGADMATFPNKLARHGADAANFLAKVFTLPKISGGDVHLLMLLGMCGFYSPNAKASLGFDLPIDLKNGVIDDAIWQRWLDHDPVRLVARHASPFANLSTLFIDCGNRDQYNLMYGARQLNALLKKRSVPHTYQEFDDDHSGTDYRYDVSLPELCRGWF
jgi:hypothetical protein